MTTLLRLPVVIERTGLSRSRIYELISAGEFPEPIKHSERVNVWPDDEIELWIVRRLDQRSGGRIAKLSREVHDDACAGGVSVKLAGDAN